MAQRYDSNSEDPGDIEQRLRDQVEITRQLGYAPPVAGDLSGVGGTAGPARKGVSGALSGAGTGATIGSVVPGIGTAIGAGVGAIAGGIGGMISGRNNDTKNEREQFAQSLGQKDSTSLWNYLGQNVDDQASNELRDRALNRIGKHDEGANQQWMSDVQAALAKGRTLTAPAASTDPAAAAPVAESAAAPVNDTSKWNTKGYATPGYVAKTPGGPLEGWDAAKWNDANYQDPKYVFGRILSEASGGSGYLKDPAQRDTAVKNILAAYPGAKFNGKDKILMPDGASIDIFGGAGSGLYKATFQVENGKDPQGRPLPVDSAGPSSAEASAMLGTSNGIVPGDTDFYNQLQAKLAEILGGPQAFERDALLRQLTGK